MNAVMKSVIFEQLTTEVDTGDRGVLEYLPSMQRA